MNEPVTFLNVLISWFPMLLLIGVWGLFIRSMRSKSGKAPAVLQEELVEEVRRQNDLIEEMIKDQGERIRRLEDKIK